MPELASLLAKAVASPGSRAQRAQVAADLIRQHSRARWVGIYTVVDDMVVNDAWSGPAAPAHPSFAVGDGLTGQAIATSSVAVSNDVGLDPRYLSNQADTGSELIVPVVVANRVLGTLDIERDVVGGFDGELIALFERLAAVITPLWS
jgi:L-methionine (R)-S-oxide reductase